MPASRQVTVSPRRSNHNHSHSVRNSKYADACCTFNDDIQGTAAVVLAAAFGAVRAVGTRMRDQRMVIHAPAPPE
jgi:malic enzyme